VNFAEAMNKKDERDKKFGSWRDSFSSKSLSELKRDVEEMKEIESQDFKRCSDALDTKEKFSSINGKYALFSNSMHHLRWMFAFYIVVLEIELEKYKRINQKA
jgi:hypothetical protein